MSDTPLTEGGLLTSLAIPRVVAASTGITNVTYGGNGAWLAAPTTLTLTTSPSLSSSASVLLLDPATGSELASVSLAGSAISDAVVNPEENLLAVSGRLCGPMAGDGPAPSRPPNDYHAERGIGGSRVQPGREHARRRRSCWPPRARARSPRPEPGYAVRRGPPGAARPARQRRRADPGRAFNGIRGGRAGPGCRRGRQHRAVRGLPGPARWSSRGISRLRRASAPTRSRSRPAATCSPSLARPGR